MSQSFPFIDEATIETILTSLAEKDDQYYGMLVQLFQQEQPALFSYLFSENMELLTDEEKNYLLYLSLVIWQSVGVLAQTVDEEMVGQLDEENWALLSEASAKIFRDRLDVFFDNYHQEDLLAFAEDALADDEDDIVTKEGRELMIVCLKTVIDSLTTLPLED